MIKTSVCLLHLWLSFFLITQTLQVIHYWLTDDYIFCNGLWQWLIHGTSVRLCSIIRLCDFSCRTFSDLALPLGQVIACHVYKCVNYFGLQTIPVTGRGVPYGCEMSRLPYYLYNRLTDGGKVVSPTRRPPFTPQEDFCYSFLLRGRVDPRAIVRLQGLGQLKKSTSSGPDPAIFLLIA
jgi:hypothetical protein